jgi:hypothetical protein
MASKPDPRAQKARKQKIILAVGGVLLVGVLAMQLPKVLKHGSSSSAPPPVTITNADGTTTTPPPVSTPASPVAPINVSASKSSALVAGVALSQATTPEAVQGQLWSFSRFKTKDPFVPQVNVGGSSSSGPTASSPSGAPGTAGGTTGSPGGTGNPPAIAVPPTFATLIVNGRIQKLTLKDMFPKADPIFVLVNLKGDTARIGVAGGAFTAGNTVVIQIGRKVTLMNTTTGQRYVVKLVYVGPAAETIAPFSGGNATTTTTPSATPASSGKVTAVSGTYP